MHEEKAETDASRSQCQCTGLTPHTQQLFLLGHHFWYLSLQKGKIASIAKQKQPCEATSAERCMAHILVCAFVLGRNGGGGDHLHTPQAQDTMISSPLILLERCRPITMWTPIEDSKHS